MKKFGKILGGIILGIVLILLAAVAILTALEYRPDQIETLNTTSGKTVHIYRRFDDDPDL